MIIKAKDRSFLNGARFTLSVMSEPLINVKAGTQICVSGLSFYSPRRSLAYLRVAVSLLLICCRG